jgi:transglutaminase-like putative cysteine protease
MLNLELFLSEDEYIDYSSEDIINKTTELFTNKHSTYDKTKITFEFVRDEIPHSCDIPTAIITSKASSVLKYKTGICHAKANLLAALLRSQGIPTGFCYQHITLAEDDSKGYSLHCFNAIYIDNQWIKVDARGNTNGRNAQFSTGKPILAFKNRQEYNEYFFDGIWATADKKTMELLEIAQNINDVLNGLPEFPETNPDIISRII